MPRADFSHPLDKVWSYPLFQALYGRRSRRFGLGFAMVDGPYQFKSQYPPVPLSEVEEAVLVAAGIGFSESALWEQSRPFPYRAGEGRTFPSTSHGRYTALFFYKRRGCLCSRSRRAAGSETTNGRRCTQSGTCP